MCVQACGASTKRNRIPILLLLRQGQGLWMLLGGGHNTTTKQVPPQPHTPLLGRRHWYLVYWNLFLTSPTGILELALLTIAKPKQLGKQKRREL